LHICLQLIIHLIFMGLHLSNLGLRLWHGVHVRWGKLPRLQWRQFPRSIYIYEIYNLLLIWTQFLLYNRRDVALGNLEECYKTLQHHVKYLKLFKLIRRRLVGKRIMLIEKRR
jgi:hypothetical protein